MSANASRRESDARRQAACRRRAADASRRESDARRQVACRRRAADHAAGAASNALSAEAAAEPNADDSDSDSDGADDSGSDGAHGAALGADGAALADSASRELSDGDAAACSALYGSAVLRHCQRALQLLHEGGVRASTAAAAAPDARADPFPLSDLILLARAAAMFTMVVPGLY